MNERLNTACVVGTGPVGLAAALALADAGVQVTVIDGGGSVEPPGAEFNRGTVFDASSSPDCKDSTLIPHGTLYGSPSYLVDTRYRGSGGSGWLWGVRHRSSAAPSVRLAAGDFSDFLSRPDLDIPAWPAPADEIIERYPKALELYGLAGQSFAISNYGGDNDSVGLDGDQFYSKLFHFGPSSAIFEDRVADLHAHENVRVEADTHLVGLKTNDAKDTVEGLIVASSDGSKTTLVADEYLLAAGGIENSRQLLLAVEDGALDDTFDVFGRWFMDHPHLRFGFITPTNPIEEFAWYDFQTSQGSAILRGHGLNPDYARANGLLRFCIDLVGRHPLAPTAAGNALTQAFDALRSRSPKALVAAIPGLLRSPLNTLRMAWDLRGGQIHNTGLGGWSDAETRLYPIGSLAVEAMFEQRPSADNRVRLGQDRDRFGRRLADLHWSWSQVEIDSINESSDLVESAITAIPGWQYARAEGIGVGDVPRAGSGAHHLGGTRQSVSPRDGVVDQNNRVHGVARLTMLGTSVFPTSVGYANPTVTAIADALRVVDNMVGGAS